MESGALRAGDVYNQRLSGNRRDQQARIITIMCELFAVNAREPVDVSGHLRVFFQHSELHPHGWGISWRDADSVELRKEPVRAIDSPLLGELLRQPVAKSRLLAHIRLATLGCICQANCHPFVEADRNGREWMMIHNGTVFNDALTTGYDGTSDSVRIIQFLMDLLDAAEGRYGRELDFRERFNVLNGAMVRLSNGNKLNVILDDGEYLYVHTNTMAKTLHVKQEPGSALFSTHPLDGSSLWEPVPTAQFQAYRDGELVCQAPPHPNIFVECAIENYLLLQTSA
jgi:glutamine amidotransferase